MKAAPLYGMEQKTQEYVEYAVIEYYLPFSLNSKVWKSGDRKDATEDDIIAYGNGCQHPNKTPYFSCYGK